MWTHSVICLISLTGLHCHYICSFFNQYNCHNARIIVTYDQFSICPQAKLRCGLHLEAEVRSTLYTYALKPGILTAVKQHKYLVSNSFIYSLMLHVLQYIICHFNGARPTEMLVISIQWLRRANVHSVTVKADHSIYNVPISKSSEVLLVIKPKYTGL